MTDHHEPTEVEKDLTEGQEPVQTTPAQEPVQTAPPAIKKGPFPVVRLIILVVVAAVLVVAVAVWSPTPPEEAIIAGRYDAEGGKTLEDIRTEQSRLRDRELPGEEPEEPPVLNIDVHVDTASGKNRLVFNVTEEHGYYVEEFVIQFWYKDSPDVETPEDSLWSMAHPLDKYVKANDTLTDCVDLVTAELELFGGDMGTDENWGAQIINHGRARLHDPDPLPALGDAGTCR